MKYKLYMFITKDAAINIIDANFAIAGCLYKGIDEALENTKEAILDQIMREENKVEMVQEIKDGKHRAVVHPNHYNSGSIEVWDAIEDWGVGFLLGNVIKYCARAGKKGDRMEDLLKAREYIDKAIEVELNERSNEMAEEQR